MKNVKMKFTGYDKESHSVLVSFASDETRSTNPDDYPSVAFQTSEMWPDINDIEVLKLKIAEVGMSIVRQQIAKENIGGNPIRQIELQKLVGMSFEYSESDFVTEEDYPTIEV
jgi:hypothetical protein